jgi:hypothetical protein
MSNHPLIQQLRFTRSEFKRALEGLSDAQARQRLMPMNCISWNVGHLAWQEQRYFLFYAQGKPLLFPQINEMFAYGAPASTPALDDMWEAWNTIIRAIDPWLDTVTMEIDAPASNLSLLVSHRREPGHPADVGTHRIARIRGRHRRRSAIPSRSYQVTVTSKVTVT